MLQLFWNSFFIGFFLAIPLGPIAFLCIHRSLHRGIQLGLITGTGAALADGFFGAIAGIGLTFISKFLASYQVIITLCGGIFLLLLGFKTLYTSVTEKLVVDVISRKQLLYAFSTGFFLTLTNPITLFSFTVVLASFGIVLSHNIYINIGTLVVGFTAGSFTWWFLLCNFVTFIFGDKLTHKTMRIINKSSGYIFVGFGIISLLSLTPFYSHNMMLLRSWLKI